MRYGFCGRAGNDRQMQYIRYLKIAGKVMISGTGTGVSRVQEFRAVYIERYRFVKTKRNVDRK